MAWLHVITCLCITLCFSLIQLQPIYHQKEAGTCYRDTSTATREIIALEDTLENVELRLRETVLKYQEMSGKYIDLIKLVGSLIHGQERLDIENICRRFPTVITSHPECRLFYNCSNYHRVDWWNPMSGHLTYLHECRYPELFSETTLRCENYTKVECGSRRESKWACDYYFHKCKLSAACKPCEYRFPRCDDKKNGPWPPDDRLTSRYVICKDGRPDTIGYCYSYSFDTKYFYNNKCTSIYDIPESVGGSLPTSSCVGKKDGKYRFDKSPCMTYMECKNGNTTIHRCPALTFFERKSQTCQSPYMFYKYNISIDC